jgi:hypothetical protein
MDKRYSTKYGMSLLENLATIQKHGIREFVRAERKHWACAACDGTIDIHRGCCSACGKEHE